MIKTLQQMYFKFSNIYKTFMGKNTYMDGKPVHEHHEVMRAAHFNYNRSEPGYAYIDDITVKGKWFNEKIDASFRIHSSDKQEFEHAMQGFVKEIYEEGYKDGFNSAYEVGYNEGYQKALKELSEVYPEDSPGE